MNDKHELIRRIEINPKVMAGKPVIHGTRLTVGLILGLLADGWTNDQILAEYKKIDAHDIAACLLFAQEALDDFAFMPIPADNC